MIEISFMDETIAKILTRQKSFHDSMKSIASESRIISHNKELSLKWNLNVIDSDNNTHSNADASSLYESIFSLVTEFNILYNENGEYLAKYFEENLFEMYDSVQTLVTYIHKIFNANLVISGKNYENLKIPLKLLKSIVEKFKGFVIDGRNFCLWEEEERVRVAREDVEWQARHKQRQLNEARLERERQQEMEATVCRQIMQQDIMYHNNIRKSVNHICSQITGDNPPHALGRIRQLIRLLEGDTIALVGSENLSISLQKYKDASYLCWHFLNQAIVTQAETQFSMNTETAVVFASMMVAVLGKFPVQMDRLFGVLEARFAQLLDATATDDDDQMPKLKGISRLIAAISVGHPPPGFAAPAGLSPARLWRLMAQLWNGNVGIGLSASYAEACAAILEMGGNSLWLTYGHQFTKLLVTIRDSLVKPRNLSERSLSLMVTNALQHNKFDLQGFLSEYSWTRHSFNY